MLIRACSVTSAELANLTLDKLYPSEPDPSLPQHALLSEKPSDFVRCITVIIRQVNISLLSLLPLLDPASYSVPGTLAHLVTQYKHLILLPVKLGFLYETCAETDSPMSPPFVRIKRPGPNAPQDETVFMQLYRSLREVPSGQFRQPDQGWRVRFTSEGAEDVGGPFRESLVLLCKDLQTSTLPLFIPCPNAQEEFGDNREKFLPNPDCTSAEHLSMYHFIGRVRPPIPLPTKVLTSADDHFSVDWNCYSHQDQHGSRPAVARLEADCDGECQHCRHRGRRHGVCPAAALLPDRYAYSNDEAIRPC